MCHCELIKLGKRRPAAPHCEYDICVVDLNVMQPRHTLLHTLRIANEKKSETKTLSNLDGHKFIHCLLSIFVVFV